MIVEDHLSLDLPAHPMHIGTARGFGARVASLAGLDDESVEDVRLAISEACTEAIAVGAGNIHLHVTCGPAGVAFELEGDGSRSPAPSPGWPDEALGGPARLELVRSLYPDAVVVSERDPFVLRFFSPASAPRLG